MPAFLTPEQLTARSRRSLWIALGLVAFIVLIFTTTFLRMRENLAVREAQNHAIAQAPAQPAAETAPAPATPQGAN
jgi:phosphotransferase system  glucose/maltose/N-acetylglucosamine-specific IIC component